MPELPEVETMRRGLLPIQGAQISAVEFVSSQTYRPIGVVPSRAAFARRAEGQTISGLGRAGKRVVLELGSGDRIVIEPRMTGLVLLADPPNVEHLRARFRLVGGSAPEIGTGAELLYWDRRGLGRLLLLSPDEFARQLGPTQLGPDALTITLEELRTRLGAGRRPVKVALLDQKILAGVGNLYAAEVLHVAGISPALPCSALTRKDWPKLHAALHAVLTEAITYEGSTLGDGTYRNALNQTGSYQNQHRVYDKAGETCRACRKGTIARIVQAQRATFYCPVCQRDRATR